MGSFGSALDCEQQVHVTIIEMLVRSSTQSLDEQLLAKLLKTREKRLEELGVSRAQPQPRRIGSRKQNLRDKLFIAHFSSFAAETACFPRR